jgi:hypothetical protein
MKYMSNKKIIPTSAFYIKLGSEGIHAETCIQKDGTVWLGYNEIAHNLCTGKEWEQVRTIFIEQLKSDPGAATRHTNQIKAFYEADENVLWITFHKNQLWWCFAKPEVILQSDGSKIRNTVDGWHETNVNRDEFDISRLSGSLLSVQGFRGTICAVREFEYLVRKINGESSALEKAAQDSYQGLRQALEKIIRELDWKEFELLTDLIFRQAGWQRISQLGKTQKTLDLELLSAIANERYWVQVKSRADISTFRKFQEETMGTGGYNRCYLVVHSPSSNLTKELETETHKLLLLDDIARLTVQYGLADWVIGKAK